MTDASPWTEFTSFLVNGAGTIALALAGGVGGSALLELVWKPRRDRRRAATVLAAEIAHNTALLHLQAHARLKNPKSIPADFTMSMVGWEVVGNLVTELPIDVLRKVVLIYNQFASLNADVAAYATLFSDYRTAPGGTAAKDNAETHLLFLIDVFNTGIDSTIDNCRALIPTLVKLGELKEDPSAPPVDAGEHAAELVEERFRRVAAMRKKS